MTPSLYTWSLRLCMHRVALSTTGAPVSRSPAQVITNVLFSIAFVYPVDINYHPGLFCVLTVKIAT